MYCSRCGTQVPDDSAFCFKCGASLRDVGPSRDRLREALRDPRARWALLAGGPAALAAVIIVLLLATGALGGDGGSDGSTNVSPIPTYAGDIDVSNVSPEPQAPRTSQEVACDIARAESTTTPTCITCLPAPTLAPDELPEAGAVCVDLIEDKPDRAVYAVGPPYSEYGLFLHLTRGPQSGWVEADRCVGGLGGGCEHELELLAAQKGRSGEPSEPFEIVAADFEDDETKVSEPSKKDGWRRAAVYLDVLYHGELEAARLGCSFNIRATLTAPNGGIYELLPRFTSGFGTLPRCGPLYPELKIRLYFEVDVPETLTSLDGSSVDAQLLGMEPSYFEGPSGERFSIEGQYEETGVVIVTKSVKLQDDLPFEQTEDISTTPFGQAVPIDGGFVRVDSITLTDDREGGELMIHATLTYTLENSSLPYDLASPFAEASRENVLHVAGRADDGGGLLIDALGRPYALWSSDCMVPPGTTRTCTADVSRYWGPVVHRTTESGFSYFDTERPDLTEVLIVTPDGAHLFRGP